MKLTFTLAFLLSLISILDLIFILRLCGVSAVQMFLVTSNLGYKRQIINGREVWLGLSKEGRVFATFPKDNANFYADTKSLEDIAEFLIMIMTYQVKEPAVLEKTEKQK